MKNVLVIGSGGREHAICWKLSQSLYVSKIFAAPGNVGIAALEKAENVALDVKNFSLLSKWCKSQSIDLVVVGPEDPLANGIADALQSDNILCFGPTKEAARIESDKNWAKEFMDRHNIPTAKWKSFINSEDAKVFINMASFRALVVKASGLAAGKGVVVAADKEEACKAAGEILTDHKFGCAGDTVVVEELLEGKEVSVLGFSDGTTVKAMLPAQDHKRALDGDLGLNTGGMGAYCPCPFLSERELQWIEENILKRAVKGLKKEGCPFVGVLYAGLMLTSDGPKVLEFNCRFGDPETQVILPLLESDLFTVMSACCTGALTSTQISWSHGQYAVGVVMASKGYPESSSKGDIIQGVEAATSEKGTLLFHSGTATTPSGLVTNGGRVLIAVVLAKQLIVAAAKAELVCSRITFPGSQYRKDIAHKGIARSVLQSGWLTYKDSGVDISAGDTLVNEIKPVVETTKRSGVMGSLGGFGALFDIKATNYSDPVLVSGTDGVGTKLKIAQEYHDHSTIGIDLVAMCVNDILAHGAEPLFFLDYFASGHLEVNIADQVIKGIVEGCKLAGCALVGGETAEMPGLYSAGDYDLAGFTVGVVERQRLLPNVNTIKSGDVVIGLLSSGVHSNGYSLIRRVMKLQHIRCADVAPFSTEGKTFGQELLRPTKIYVKDVLPALHKGNIKAVAHITGGGLLENVPRILPSSVKVQLDASRWNIPALFGWIAGSGISEKEMLCTFNCGVGLVLIVSAEAKDEVLKTVPDSIVIGSVLPYQAGEQKVEILNFAEAMEPLMQSYITPIVQKLRDRKRVAVLISGSGTNLQALIDATSGSNGLDMASEIVLVISNKDKVEGLKRAERSGIPTKVIKHTAYTTRDDFDAAFHAELVQARTDIVCLAGFMRVLTGGFVQKWRGRLLNIHPSLLPAFKGVHAQKQALDAGVRLAGCSVHFVEEDIDSGAIVAQKSVPIEVGDTVESLTERVKTVEHVAYPEALKLVATGQAVLDLETNKIIWNVQ